MSHLAEELWERLGHAEMITIQDWPAYDDTYLIEEEVELAVMIGGKVRAKIMVAKDSDEETVKKQALENEKVKEWLSQKTLRKIIVVPGRMVNIVAS